MAQSRMALANQLLVATPSLQESSFERSVIYICEHHVQGTVGLIINRPMKYSLDVVFNQLHIEAKTAITNHQPLLCGGPVQPERGFVIHRPFGDWQSSLELIEKDVTITTSNDIIRAIADDKGPADALVILGFVGWSEHQLESEIMSNDWLVCPFQSDLLYNVPYENRWEEAGLSIGVHMNQLTLGAGHA